MRLSGSSRSHRRRLAVRQRRRAHQRHRLARVRQADPRRRLRGAVEVARRRSQNGAQIIDVNMDEAMLDSEGGDGRRS
jgi:cobalamin-dependent methionine synthase I